MSVWQLLFNLGVSIALFYVFLWQREQMKTNKILQSTKEKKEESEVWEGTYTCVSCGENRTYTGTPFWVELNLCADCGWAYKRVKYEPYRNAELKRKAEERKVMRKRDLLVKKAIKKGVLKL